MEDLKQGRRGRDRLRWVQGRWWVDVSYAMYPYSDRRGDAFFVASLTVRGMMVYFFSLIFFVRVRMLIPIKKEGRNRKRILEYIFIKKILGFYMREVASLPFELSNSFDILPCCKKKERKKC